MSTAFRNGTLRAQLADSRVDARAMTNAQLVENVAGGGGRTHTRGEPNGILRGESLDHHVTQRAAFTRTCAIAAPTMEDRGDRGPRVVRA